MTDLEKAIADGGQPVETDLSRALAEGGTPVADEGAAAPPAAKPRSFLDRASFAIHHPIESAKEELGLVGEAAKKAPGEFVQSFENFGHNIKRAAGGALDLVSPVTPEGGVHVPFSQLADAPYRRELERGVSDTVTAGAAEKVANAASHALHEKFPSQVGDFQTTAASDAAAAPDARAVGAAGGTLLKSPFTKLAEVGGIIPGTGPLASAARGAAGYELSAVPQAATQAAINAPEGHRLEAAGEAALRTATDPASLLTSAAIPATTSFLAKKLDTAAARAPEVQASAQKRAVKDLGKDITSAEGVKSKVTDQKRIAEVNERLYELADKNPELRQAFSEPAEKALPKVRAFKAQLAQPLDRLYDALDEHTGGGLDPHQVVGELRTMAKDARKTVAGLADSERLGKLADQFEQVYITEREPVAPPPEIAKNLQTGEKPSGYTEAEWQQIEDEWNGKHTPEGSHETVGGKTNAGGKGAPAEDLIGALEQLRKLRENAKGVAAKGLDEQIAKLEGEQAAAAPPTEVSAHPAGGIQKIPTRVFRQEVTDLLKKSDSVMGGIEGTPRFEALQKLYDAGKTIIDKHIDGSGLPPEQIAQIRDINNGYFLLNRAEQAIESRGWKEANREGFHFAHSARQALHGGLVPAAAYGMMHPHALPYIAGAAAMTHAVPAAAKSLNWQLAHGSYTRAVGRLVDLARKTPRAEFIGQAARAVGPDAALRIYNAAQKAPARQEASP